MRSGSGALSTRGTNLLQRVISEHVFPKGSNDRYTVGEFFSVPVFTNIIQDTMRKLKKTTLKTKVANTKCRLFATILMHPAGLSWFKIMRPL